MPTANQPLKIGKYEILSTLGRGGMGVVYKARDPMIDRIVAVKTMLVEEAVGDESLLERLHMEARSAGRLHHPNVVTVFDFGQQDDLSYIVMEFVDGINLARLIDERRVVGLRAKVSILIQIAEGLAYAHEQGVVHRDMKPSNVCVTSRGTAKILDFGLARYDDTRLTKTGQMAGTVAYMSPERLNGTTGPKDDIFALGAIAYELLTYTRAFPGSMAEVVSKIIAPTPPPRLSDVADVPPELDPIVLKALAKDVEARYDSAAEFANDLRQFEQSEALETYLTDERRATLEKSEVEFIDSHPSAHAYSGPSSAKRPATPPPTMRIDIGGDPTRIEEPPTIVTGTNAAPAPTQPAFDHSASAARTEVVTVRPLRPKWVAAAAAVIVLGSIGALIVLRKPAPAPQNPVVATNAPVSPPVTATVNVTDQEVTKNEMQLATARSLSEELERRPLNHDELLRLSEAKARLTLAEKKLQEKNYDGGARLIADSIAGLKEVMITSGERMQQATKGAVERPLPEPKRQQTVAAVTKPNLAPPPVAQVPAPRPPVQTQTVEPPVSQTQSASAPHPATQQNARPAESPEEEITAFMRQLAAAYQSKDVSFFREHSLRFSSDLANAIRNSPSVRVDLQIVRIDLRDPQHANVHVRRTDWFPGSATPPAVQALAYLLEKSATGWRINSLERD